MELVSRISVSRLVSLGTSGEEMQIDAAAAKLEVSRVTLYKLIREGKLDKIRRPGDRKTYVDLGEARHALNRQNRVLVDREIVEALLKAVSDAGGEEVEVLIDRLTRQIQVRSIPDPESASD